MLPTALPVQLLEVLLPVLNVEARYCNFEVHYLMERVSDMMSLNTKAAQPAYRARAIYLIYTSVQTTAGTRFYI